MEININLNNLKTKVDLKEMKLSFVPGHGVKRERWGYICIKDDFHYKIADVCIGELKDSNALAKEIVRRFNDYPERKTKNMEQNNNTDTALKEKIIAISDAMKICAGTELKDLNKVEEERCREILVEINLNRGKTICVRNNAFDSIISGTYVGGDIVVNGNIVEVLDGARYTSENYSYFTIPISHIEYVQYKILGNIKYDKENQQLCYEDKRYDMPAVSWEKVCFMREVTQRPYENLL